MSTADRIMSNEVISATLENSVGDVIEIFAANNISGLPIVDKNERVIGMISERDILDYSNRLHVIPLIASSGWISPYTNVVEIAAYEKGFKSLLTASVLQVMNTNVTTIHKQTPVDDITKLMVKKEVNRIPVVDDNERLCGIITRSDVIQYLACQDQQKSSIITSE